MVHAFKQITTSPGGPVSATAPAAVLERVSHASPAAILAVFTTGRIVWANTRARALLELPDGVTSIGTSEDLVHGLEALVTEDVDGAIARMEAFYADDRDEFADQLQTRGGRVVNRYGSVLRDDTGAVEGWAWYLLDVTEQAATERMLRESNSELDRLSRTLQSSLLPPHLPRIGGIQLGAAYRAARDGLSVGGDYYDVFRTGRGRWGVVVGDVSGKGAEAAALTALMRYSIRAAAEPSASPARVLGSLNEIILREQTGERFTTVAFAAVRRVGGRVLATLALGGHPLPIVRRADGDVHRVGRPGTAIGLLPELDLENTPVHLDAGDLFVAYTDGVTEARGQDEEHFGDERLAQLLKECGELSAQEVADKVLETVFAWQHGLLRDDAAIVVLRITR